MIRHLAVMGLLGWAGAGQAADQLALPDELSRWRTAALLERVDADLLASTSATLTLESWCADRAIATPAQVTVERADTGTASIPDQVRARLGVPPDATIGYRKVRLVCGGHVLSEAENWYVPGRLTPAMNAALDGSDTPFGKVIRPLDPHRKTLGLVRDWSPLAGPGSSAPAEPSVPCDRTAFSHEALVLDGKGRPLALVAEHYKVELVCAIGAAGSASPK